MSAARACAALLRALAVAAIAFFAQPYAAAADAHGDVAWRLAALAERMGKLHAQAGQGLLAERARRGLAEAIGQFDALARQAAAGAPTPEARDNYLLLRLIWHEYRPWLGRAATRENARRIAERTEEIAWIALKGARLAEARAGRSQEPADAARACVLAQRVSRLLLLRRWDLRDDASTRELGLAARELGAILERLGALSGNSAEIAAELQVARNQHVFLERAAEELALKPTSPRAIEIVAKTGDNLLESMQRVGRLYAEAAISAAPR